MDFIELTADLYGEHMRTERPVSALSEGGVGVLDRSHFESEAVWRKALFGNSTTIPPEDGDVEVEEEE